jgi:hypothetical protein
MDDKSHSHCSARLVTHGQAFSGNNRRLLATCPVDPETIILINPDECLTMSMVGGEHL